ncbi:MAG TPA: acyl-CoA dehydrogenase C-terminal domain-containing protein [Burkholderiales bacterium]|nr:acyl-CoA dehydrogenase C-terminal domain-containing protein [Burkholderiales bacterium]
MAVYKAPLRDIRFVLNEMLDVGSVMKSLPGCEEATPELFEQVLEEAGKFAENVLFPLNRTGDEEGCHINDGVVTTPKGFKEAYQAFCEGGWPSLDGDPAYGGQGLPYILGMYLNELMSSANMAWSMYPGLTHGAYNAVHAHGSQALKDLFLPKLLSGQWTGTMCLTESHCGTDLGMLRTKAIPQLDGAYRITGTKIFISSGEHDLTENIVHLVLARLPDAPSGIKGISLFLAPKFLVNPDGSLGVRNGVKAGSLEHKMGIRANATAVMNFDDALGYLIGEPNKGMQAMFTMMNAARLGVGLQGLSIGEVAYQSSLDYAKERIQMRSLTGPKNLDGPADPIIVHPDVRRMLLTQKAYNEAGRAMAAWIALQIDIEAKHPDEAVRKDADDLVALLTPVAKAFMTDNGFAGANLGLQCFGGHGYIKEWGMEQLVRDARIAMIYEGTNGIQALDLIGRKILMDQGQRLRKFTKIVHKFCEANRDDPAMGEFIEPVAKLNKEVGDLTMWVGMQALQNQEEAAAAATDYLRLFGHLCYGYFWARMVQVALPKQNGDEASFYQAKLTTARFYFARVFPETLSLAAAIRSGSKSLMEMPIEQFKV